ncbi:hypothetical protein SAMN05444339_1224 [Loktanella atrilutea]|uniref:TnsA endonuclease N terminal n=1 Tax=Loktanella atrilutea TaxID=366533 RepID=A0A1M5FKU7_LOKAT|nr:hypothetical protein [Loktanella atrilutea]SHF92115.1 hypothetical protein SAMN05444339_1224 [Loktanella atrilutea]
MSLHRAWDPTPEQLPRRDALELGTIPGVLPVVAARNPTGRSSVSHKITATFATPMDGYKRRLYHFESSLEYAVALEALLSGECHGLEIQLPPVRYLWRGRWKNHHFDLRITRTDGHRIAVFVRNDASLARISTQAEIAAIFSHIPAGFCDQAVVVGSSHYSRVLQENLRRMWEAIQMPDGEADEVVLQVAREARYWDVEGLINQCGIPRARAWRATLRLIAARRLATDWHAMIDYPCRIKCAA